MNANVVMGQQFWHANDVWTPESGGPQNVGLKTPPKGNTSASS